MRSALDQASPGRVLGRDCRRFERCDQSLDRCEVNLHVLALVPLGRDPENPSGRLVAEGVADDAGIVPVGDEDRAIGRCTGVDGPEPGISARQEHLVLGAERRSLSSQGEKVDLPGAGIDLEHAAEVLIGQKIPFVDHDSRGASVAGAHEFRDVARHVLTPVPWTAGSMVAVAAAVHRADQPAAAVAVIVVVACEDVAAGIQAGLVVVPLTVADDLELRPVAVGPQGVGKLIGRYVPAALVDHVEVLLPLGFVLLNRAAAVTLREVELAVETQNHAMNAVVGVDPAEARQHRIALIGPVVAVGVLEDLDLVRVVDPVKPGIAAAGQPVVQPLGDPDPAPGIDVDVRRVHEHRLRRPEGCLQPGGRLEPARGFGRADLATHGYGYEPRGKTKTQDMPDSMTGAWHREHDHRRLPVVDRPPRRTDRWFVVLSVVTRTLASSDSSKLSHAARGPSRAKERD